MLEDYCTVLLVGVGSRDGDLLGSLLRRRPREGDGEDAVGHRRLDVVGLRPESACGCSWRHNVTAYDSAHLDSLRERQRTGELAEAALPNRVALVVPVARDGRLARDAEDVVLDVDLDVLLGEAWEFERGCDEVLLGVLMEVHPAGRWSLVSIEIGRGQSPMRQTYLGRMGRTAAFSLEPERATAEEGAPRERALKASSKRRSKSARE